MNKEEEKNKLFIPFLNVEGIITDPQGSYTGVTEEIVEEPVQDVDDL